MTNDLILIDSTSNSLTVSWPETPGATRYVLQYRKATNSDREDDLFETLSDKLTTTQARKRNLVEDADGVGFVFRAGAVLKGSDTVSSWKTHDEPFHLISESQEKNRMKAPTVSLGGSNEALLVAWNAADNGNTTAYELQMRENSGGAEWKTIASAFTGTEVRKKNLTSSKGYMFRVRPAAVSDQNVPFSPPSEPVVALGLSAGLKRLFGSLEDGTLLQKVDKPVPLADAVGGKEFVLLYASAHWCGPCRQFTPMLSQWYNSLGANKTVEVVFLSADHDERGFKDYYGSMPWMAVDYNDDAREQLMGFIRVSGIPRLAVVDGRTGRIIEDNAVGKPLDINRWRTLAAGAAK